MRSAPRWRQASRALRPVIMTALAMIIGMIPMALGLGESGEQNAPLRPRRHRRPDIRNRGHLVFRAQHVRSWCTSRSMRMSEQASGVPVMRRAGKARSSELKMKSAALRFDMEKCAASALVVWGALALEYSAGRRYRDASPFASCAWHSARAVIARADRGDRHARALATPVMSWCLPGIVQAYMEAPIYAQHQPAI